MIIEKNVNIIKDPKIKRLVEYKEGDKQVNVLDSRFYKRDDKYYPSVTSVLNYFPKNQFFHSWLKDVGHNADIIAQKAAGEGTQVHNAIERFINGEEIEWIDQYGKAIYNLDVWKMILKFADFWNTHKPELIVAEYHLFSDVHEYAGTADLVVRLNNKIWLLDIKTSNSLHTSYGLQLSAYAMAWNETHSELIEDTGILWLKASTRTEGKNGKIQGKGWELKQYGNIASNFIMFKNIYEIYKMENPDFKPYTEILPISIKLTS
jgi:genome maintenance exonuclease 1